jgi:protein O-mannosyl-transferase
MPAAPFPAPPPAGPGSRAGSDTRWLVWLALGVIGLATLAAYANSFATPFVFDDWPGIVRNATIRHLWPPWDVLRTPADGGSATVGRPLVNVSLALNYAVGGLDVRGYHVVNFLLHLLASLTLFGVVRRTLAQPGLRGRFSTAALPVAFGTALVWCVHPLQTEAVSGLPLGSSICATSAPSRPITS